jgi:hypothetical protein
MMQVMNIAVELEYTRVSNEDFDESPQRSKTIEVEIHLCWIRRREIMQE